MFKLGKLDKHDLVILRTVADVRRFVAARRRTARKIALVPTMGALHDGHLELVRRARIHANTVMVSIFVNPTQFGPAEDFSAYPRTWESDLEKLKTKNTDAVFAPTVAEMYMDGASTKISVGGLTDGLCGPLRPGHFEGVATIVAKLLLQTMPDAALFGEKDFQQLQVIRRLVSDLDIPVEIIGVPTVRDEHGLALSSRNAYLTLAEIQTARQINKILHAMAADIGNNMPVEAIRTGGLSALEKAGFDKIDYLEIVDQETLQTAGAKNGRPLRILTAVRLGKARLIDNVPA